MELPAYDPRGAWGMGIAYATSCRGGCHLKAWTLGVEVMHPKYDRFSPKGKGRLVFELQNERAINDAIGVCTFGGRAIGVDEMVRMVTVLTGWSFNSKKLLETGERIYNVERIIATREGITRKDDTLPPRLLTEALPRGPSKGVHLRREDLDQMLDEYYAVRGWNQNGKPTKAKLEELSIPKLLGR
jgi:aldehyde:ferredoxin oxidoreductase